MKHMSWILLAAVLAGGCGERPNPLQPEVGEAVLAKGGQGGGATILERRHSIIDFNRLFFNRCVPERVRVSGRLNIVSHAIVDASGQVHEQFHANPVGVSGTGLRTGDRYRLAGAESSTYKMENPGDFQSVLVQNLRLISTGSGPNLLIHAVFFAKVTDGTLTWQVLKMDVDCR